MSSARIGLAVFLSVAGLIQPAAAEEAAASVPAAGSAPVTSSKSAPTPVSSSASASAPSGAESSLRSRLDFAKGLYARDMYDMAYEEYEAILRDTGAKDAAGEALLGSGESLFFLKRYPEARERFETFVARNPNSPEVEKARLRSGESMLYGGQKEEAFAVFHDLRGAKDDTVRIAARYYEGKISFDQGFMNAAVTHFREVIDSPQGGPYAPFARYYLGEAMLAQNQFEDAARVFGEAADAENPEVRQLAQMGLGKALAAAERHVEAAEAFGLAGAPGEGKDESVSEDAILNRMNALVNAERFDQLLETAEAEKNRIRDPKKQVEFKLLSAKGLARSGQKDAAQGVYREVMKAEGLKPEETKAAKLGIAQSMIAQGQGEEVLAFLDSDDARGNLSEDEILFLRAEAMRKLGRADEALAEYEKIVALTGSEFRDEAMLARAYQFSERGEFAKGVEAFRAYVGAYPQAEMTPRAFSDMILAEIKLKDYAKAIEDSQRFLDRYSDGPEAQKVHLRMAGLYTETARYDLAAEIYDNHARRFAGSVNAKEIEMLRAANSQRGGDARGALKIYGKISAKDVSPERYAELLKNRAFAYVTLKRYRAAAETYLRLFRHYGSFADDPAAYLWTADVFAHSGSGTKLGETVELFEKKFGADSHPVEREYYRAELNRLKGRSDEAVAGYDRVLGEGGELAARAALGKGLALSAKGNGAAAEDALEEALKLAGDDHRLSVKIRMKLGDMYLDAQNYKEAAKTFFAVAILYDDSETVPQALWGAGQAFEKAKDIEKATQAYRELGERYPRHALVRDAQKRLDALT